MAAAASSIGGAIPTQPSSSVIANKTTTSILIKPNHQSLSSSYSSSSSNLLSLKITSGRGGRRRIPFVVSPKDVSVSNKSSTCSVDPDATRGVLGIILGDGFTTYFPPYTKRRTKPHVPFPPNDRLIDMFVSNCLNSNISNIYVLTQVPPDRSRVLEAYASRINEGFVQILTACSRESTADAVRQYLWLFEQHINVTEYLILAGDYSHRMDYEKFIQAHRETEADITVAALPIDENRTTSSFGLMKIDEKGRIIEFSKEQLKIDEKGRIIEFNFKPYELKAMKVDTTILGLDDKRAAEMPYIASMGMYVVSKDVLLNLLRDKFSAADEFERVVIPGAASMGLKVQAHLYDGNWEDIGILKDF
ncbi:hypothetical protein MKW94_009507, partial [Papaver nudicaule]|nr:hypothetical protein [Papaver nudicaule]